MLEDMSYVTAEQQDGRKVYTITGECVRRLAEETLVQPFDLDLVGHAHRLKDDVRTLVMASLCGTMRVRRNRLS